MLPQDLHIHTVFSSDDASIVPEQTVELIAAVKHAEVVGISDHFENLVDGKFELYAAEVKKADLKLGIELDGHPLVKEAAMYDVDYFIVHCRDNSADYRAMDSLNETGKPVIVAHPNIFNTNLNLVPENCLIEINNRYVWRNDWYRYYYPHVNRFKFVISSDAHQPNWLSQAVARHAARVLGVQEHLVFEVPNLSVIGSRYSDLVSVV